MSSDAVDKWSKRIFVAALSVVMLGGAFGYGALAYKKNLPPIPQLRTAAQMVTGAAQDVSADPKSSHLQPTRGQGSGVVTNTIADDGSLVMMAGFFDEENQIRLIRRNGDVVKKWPLSYRDHFPDTATRPCDVISDLMVDTHGAHVTPDGEVAFNYEYCGTVKLDQCGEVLWTIASNTHHSLVTSESGGYWILGRDIWPASERPGHIYPFSTPATDELIHEDTLLKVSESGEILDQFSIPLVMAENGMEAILTANGENFHLDRVYRVELVHANKATELPAALADAFPLFEAGDIAISMRELNLVMVLDPETRTVKWHQTGPWLRQHDPEFRTDGRISIFNNNVYRMAYPNDQTDLTTPRITNIMAVDPETGETEVVFGGRDGQEILSVIRGQHELLPNGGMIITEFDAGRVIEVDANGNIVWEYVNEYDEDFVGEVINSAVLPAGYFKSEWKTCTP